MEKVTLYTANHQPATGILDYIDILKSIFKRKGVRLVVSESLDVHGVNLIIDEFSSYYSIRYIQEMKKENKQMRLVYILTEFVTPTRLFTTFNYFEGVLKGVFLPLYHIWIASRRPVLGVHLQLADYLRALAVITPAAVSLVCYAILRVLSFFRLPLARRYIDAAKRQMALTAYMHRRFLGLFRVMKFADGVAIIHPKLRQSAEYLCRHTVLSDNDINEIFPEFADDLYAYNSTVLKKFSESVMRMEQTGTITSYRHSFTLLINQLIVRDFKFDLVIERSFSDPAVAKIKPSAYTVHPPQTRHWQFSSPTRIYRGLRSGSVPILTKVFGDHPIEQVCLHFEASPDFLFELQYMHNNPGKLSEYMQKRIAEYNGAVRSLNDDFVESVLHLATADKPNTGT